MRICTDCKYYLAVDVFKGLCKLDKDKITPEDKACSDYEQTAKCKFCKNYTPESNELGWCKGKAEAYPEMLAFTCKEYMKVKEN